MKCDELKKRLADKDQEVKEIRENTIAIFNETKDLIVDDLIQRTIENEFKVGELIYSHKVYDLILDSAKLEHNLLHEGLFSFCGDHLLQKPYFSPTHINRDDVCKAVEQKEKVDEFFKKFDYELFSSMLKKYILSKGFEQKIHTNIYGQKFKSSFFITTRSKLENQCCSNNPVAIIEETDKKFKPNIPLTCLLCLMLVILLIIVFLPVK